MAIRDRFVEVLADRGPEATPRWTVGSGFLVSGRYVLTSGHVAAEGSLLVRRIDSGNRSAKTGWPARLRLIGDLDSADLALVELEDGPGPHPPVGFARIDRHTRETTMVEHCSAVGFPEFKKQGTGTTAQRETAQVDGSIPTSEDLGSGLLTLRVSSSPRPLPPTQEALGLSPWSGMSGAAALVGGRVIGVVSEHQPRAGQSALTLVPVTFIDRLPDAGDWWEALGVDRARLPILPKPDPLCVGELPEGVDHYQRRQYNTDLESAMTTDRLVVLSPERTGLGGVGKTQLAGAYARNLWEREEVDLLVWVRADERDKVVKSYQEVATAVETDSLLPWLATTDRRWLIVLDDLTDLRHMEGLWPPDHPSGRVLVTTRDWHPLSDRRHARHIEMGPFTPDEATAYIIACLDCGSDEAAELAHALRFQPVALAEAVSYIRRHDLDCLQYCRRFGDRHRLLPRLLLGNQATADVQRSVIAVAWSLGVEARGAPKPETGLSPARYEMTTNQDGTQTVKVELDGSFGDRILDRLLPPGWGTDG